MGGGGITSHRGSTGLLSGADRWKRRRQRDPETGEAPASGVERWAGSRHWPKENHHVHYEQAGEAVSKADGVAW